MDVTNELELWDLNEETGTLTYETSELDALADCFPHFNLDVELTLETFTALLSKAVDQRDWDGRITAEHRQQINAVLDLYRTQIEMVQAKVDALATYVAEPRDPGDAAQWSHHRLVEEVKRLRAAALAQAALEQTGEL